MVLLTGEWLRIQSVSRSLIERSEGTEDEKILSSKNRARFSKVFQAGNSFANRKFVVYVLPKEQSHFRVGLSVGKKVGNAVKRNEIKRKIRASLTEMKPRIEPAVDFIVIARPSIATCSSKEIYSNLEHVLKLAKIIH